MNILMALSQLEVTGAEVYGTTLTDSFIERGHKVYIVSDTLTKETKGIYKKIEFNKRSFFNRIAQVRALVKLIKENDIQVVHAHSRASAWSSAIACKLTGIPLVTTTHGRQPVHLSRKILKFFGDKGITVCENIKDHLVRDLGVKEDRLEVIRNGIDITSYIETPLPQNKRKKISIIGRLSGPKGQVVKSLLDKVLLGSDYQIQIIGGKDIPDYLKEYEDRVEFLGYVSNIPEKMKESDLVIGAGRVAVEGILSARPVVAIGEAKSVGLITRESVEEGLRSNFGDIGINYEDTFDYEGLKEDVEKALQMNEEELHEIRVKVKSQFDLKSIVRSIEIVYQHEIVKKHRKELPILMYHRVVKDESEIGVHGTYVTAQKFREHMEILRDNGYKTLTFKDLGKYRFKKRFDRDRYGKEVMITFDDGYVDNYKYAFPILKEFGFTAVIYMVTDLKYNKWDVDNINNPEKEFHLMSHDEIREMNSYGIEFGGHTRNHVKLSRVDVEEAREEIAKSKEELEEIIGERVLSFAYPYGDLNDRVKQVVEESGYKFGVSTDSGSVCFSDDLYQIRRIGIFPDIKPFGFKRKIKGNYNFIKIKREKRQG